MTRSSRRSCLQGLACAVLLTACEDAPPGGPSPPGQPPLPPKPRPKPSAESSAASSATAASSAPPPPAASASARPRDLDQACSSAPDDAPPLDIVQFALTSKLEKRKPTDELTIIKPGTKVYAYVVVKNLETTERCVLVTFRVNGNRRAALTLDIGTSPTWRTWANITPSDKDAPGTLEVEVTDDHGRERFKQKILIEPG